MDELVSLKQSARRTRDLRVKYGLTDSDVFRMKEEQGFDCAICGRPFRVEPQVDHDHKTGKVRGLLCFSCNAMLGNARDKVRVLRAGIKYLRKHR